ncbi:hypothetical protein [Phenylobacterium soli]|uniref:Uncharacterized protein n=1 Tax=Phenylobacterium soli TaxID=2170551 RepID=A0A328AQM3_9CAUL|nr:hypothetical protein [Phenylobacterium soli]RAK55218.1 hypothetical protein DJ017_12160 [Phenylobacterium soli]
MTPDSDIVPTPQSQILSRASEGLSAPLDEDIGAATLFQEINERRARIENAELLRHLRGL